MKLEEKNIDLKKKVKKYMEMNSILGTVLHIKNTISFILYYNIIITNNLFAMRSKSGNGILNSII